MRLRARIRRGYTLLELMLAMAIALIIMAALYVAIDILFREMEEGRALVEQCTLARALFQRMSADMTPSLGPVTPPVSNPSQSSQSSNTMTSSSPMPAPTPTEDTQTGVVLSIGVKGESDHVSIFQTRLSSSVINPPNTAGTPPAISDVSRITYFLDGDKGLCREEI